MRGWDLIMWSERANERPRTRPSGAELVKINKTLASLGCQTLKKEIILLLPAPWEGSAAGDRINWEPWNWKGPEIEQRPHDWILLNETGWLGNCDYLLIILIDTQHYAYGNLVVPIQETTQKWFITEAHWGHHLHKFNSEKFGWKLS